MTQTSADLLFELGTEELPAGPLATMAEALGSNFEPPP